MAGKWLFGVTSDAIANFMEEPLARGGSAINESDVKQNVVQIRLRDRCPQRPSHLVEDSFPRQPLAQSSEDLRVVKGFR